LKFNNNVDFTSGKYTPKYAKAHFGFSGLNRVWVFYSDLKLKDKFYLYLPYLLHRFPF